MSKSRFRNWRDEKGKPSTSLAVRSRSPLSPLSRWVSEPQMTTSNAEDMQLSDTMRRFSAPSIVDPTRAQQVDRHTEVAFIAYHKAISALGESLKDSELEGILHTSPTDLHKVATHVLEQVPMDSKSGHFLDVINNYSTVLDIISQGSPQFGCLIWGLLKFVLIVSQNHQMLLQKVSHMLFKIGFNIPKIICYRELLPSDRMLELISQLYAAIVEFLRETAIYFRQKTIRKYMTALWSPFEARFKKLEERINELQLCVESEANLGGLVTQHVQFNEIGSQVQGLRLQVRELQTSLREVHDINHKAFMFQNMRKTLFLGYEIEAQLHDELAKTYSLTASPDWARWFKVEQRYVPSVFSRDVTISQALSDAPDPQHALQWISRTRTKYQDVTAVFLLWSRGMTVRAAIASMIYQIFEQRPHVAASASMTVQAASRANLSQSTLFSLFQYLIRELGGIMIYVTMGSVGVEEFKLVETLVNICKTWNGPPINLTMIHPMNDKFVIVDGCVDLDEIYDVHPALCCSDALHQIILLEMHVHEDLSETVSEQLWETVWRELRYAMIGIALDQAIEVLRAKINEILENESSSIESDVEKLYEWAGSLLKWVDNEIHLNDMREQIQRHMEIVDLHLEPEIKMRIRQNAKAAITRPRIGRGSFSGSFRERDPEEVAPDPSPIPAEQRDILWAAIKEEIRKTTFEVYCISLDRNLADNIRDYINGEDAASNVHAQIFGKNGKWRQSFPVAKESLSSAIVNATEIGFDGIMNIMNNSRSG